MSAVFADTHFYLAILNRTDRAHQIAVEFAESSPASVVTTAWILTEIGDSLCHIPDGRIAFSKLLQKLQHSPEVTIVPFEQSLFDRAVALYTQRPDKKWSLTDCISFVVMQDHGITEAYTGDRHFEQAGFVALLK